MNQELTTEQKARVFAQYIGHQVRHQIDEDRHQQNTLGAAQIDGIMLRGNSGYWSASMDAFKLLLRPLSAITDEDAIEVARLLGYEYPRNEKGQFVERIDLVEVGRGAIGGISRNGLVETFNVLAEVIQFLIQRGYAVPTFVAPNHPLNGKTPIEMGLAIDITTIQ